MERYKKKDLLQTVDTLLKANDAIVRTTRTNPEKAAEALAQCQESAIALGTYIDTLGEKYASLVHVLEDYCENIYQMSESLSDENTCRKVSKRIQKQLTGLCNSIKYDMPEDRKEVVFLPYKASMWDSLESVWKAADEDPDCDAYVIPIPYYDRNPDESFREEHYEGDQYPAYVPITRYDEYDLAARRPDVIYIHNPYDECNHVTSVHPYFYAKNLRNFTDKLVYIPYFILGEIEPDNQAAIDGMKHFCFTPGTVYADRVIVQSENMRQIYINEYIKAAKDMGLSGEHVDRKFLEKKFLGLGSPKVDKVLNTKKEDLDIPAEWLKVIEKPDGSWKKIVFYNTSVSALLQHDEKMLQKMESVFELFKGNQDEVALLWRPHPLIQATIESMRPQLWEAYKEIRDRYVEEGWGIYDDSADVDRAVVLSDAYYGDRSSVIYLYRELEKKVLIQQCFVQSSRVNSIALTEAVAEADGYYWYVPLWKNALFRMNKETLETEWLCSFQNEKIDLELYANICVHGEELIFVPCKAKKIAIYNRLQKDMTTIDFLEESYQTKDAYSNDWFMQYVVMGEKMYFIPCMYHSLVCMDLETKVISKIRITEDSPDGEIMQISSTAAAVWEQRFYFVSEDESLLYVFDTKTKCLQKLNLRGKRYSGIFCIRGQLWLIPCNGSETLDIYDLESEKIVDKLQFPEKVCQYSAGIKGRSFTKGAVRGRKIYLLANLEVTSVVIDIETRKITEWHLPTVESTNENCLNWVGLFKSEDRLYAINGLTGEWAVEDGAQETWTYWKQKAVCTNIRDFQDDYAVEFYGNMFGSRVEDLVEIDSGFQADPSINMGREIYLATR